MKWIKRGRIFDPVGKFDWLVSHAAVPFADHLDGDVFRVYFTGRDGQNRGLIGYFDVDITEPTRILYLHDTPLLPLGVLGAFDDHGVIGSSIVESDGRKYCYYAGLTLGRTVPFYFFVGLAVSRDGKTFRKVSPAPILERSSVDPYLTGHVCVRKEGALWRMWYVSGHRWAASLQQPRHYYHIKYAESADGIVWQRDGIVSIDFRAAEYAIARPSVVRDTDGYRMWYCYRGESYRIGYAESPDGRRWDRRDADGGLDVSASGWDSGMTAYPFVFDHKGARYMLYNGNDYGKTGIGLAVLDQW